MNKNRYVIFERFEDLDNHDKELVNAADNALDSSYAPYSHFHVAAAIRLLNNKIITGVNQENASSPAGLCAEQVALYRKGAVYPEQEIETIAIVARKDSGGSVPISPCGNCRQVMAEFVHRQNKTFSVLMNWKNGSWLKIYEMADLLPFSFTAKSR